LRAEAELVLTQARREKSERTKLLGFPIQIPGKALAIRVHDGTAWIAENTTIAKKIDLETGKTIQIYRGHTGPVTCLAFCDKVIGSGDNKILVTGSWDRTIKIWNTDTKELISSTTAHSDFVKSLFVFPSINLLVSGSSDKTVRFWDLSAVNDGAPLTSLGFISSHTRPVECLDGFSLSETSAVLFTADTMGVIKIWDLEKDKSPPLRWLSNLRTELDHHRTRINEMLLGNEQLWTASSDETVQIIERPLDSSRKLAPPITHPVAVRCILPLSLTDLAEPYIITGAGDIIRVYDVSTFGEPELIGQVDAHWHDVTALRLWVRKTLGVDGKRRVEPWIISASLDGTIRKWNLRDLLNPQLTVPIIEKKGPATPLKAKSKDGGKFELTEEEERELAELLSSDDD